MEDTEEGLPVYCACCNSEPGKPLLVDLTVFYASTVTPTTIERVIFSLEPGNKPRQVVRAVSCPDKRVCYKVTGKYLC